MEYLLIPILGLENRLRGSNLKDRYGKIAHFVIASKYVVSVRMAAEVAYICGADWLGFGLLVMGFAALNSLGWGSGLMATHGKNRWNGKYHKLTPVIDFITRTLYEFFTEKHYIRKDTSLSNSAYRNYGALFMGIRYYVLGIPLFGVLAYIFGTHALLYGASFLGVGLIYLLCGRLLKKYPAQISEVCTGCYIGAIIQLIVR